MKYIVLRIDEDVDYGCEERDETAPVMAIVTLRDENGSESKTRQVDKRLYELNINEGDPVYFNEKMELVKY